MGKAPLFPFGHGLSFTTFGVTDIKVAAKGMGMEISSTISNTGNRDGAVVLQLYVGLPEEKSPRPLRQLCGFKRVELKSGSSSTVTIPVSLEELKYWDPSQKQWVMPTGAIRLDLGLSERDIRQTVMIPSLLGDTATSP